MRVACRLTVGLAVLAAATCGQSPNGDIKRPGAVVVATVTEPLDITEPDQHAIGRLRYRGGISLSSEDQRFGGLSALSIAADGRSFLAVSDAGYWVSGGLRYDENGDLSDVTDVFLKPMLRPDGTPLRWGSESDAESMAVMRDQSVVVSFERVHRLWRYSSLDARPQPVKTPPDFARQPANGGVEALTALADDRLLAISEDLETSGGVKGWLQDEHGGWSTMTWRTSQGFVPTGAATLPDGDVMVLERRFPPVGARLRLLPITSLRPESVADGKEVARLEGSTTVDNMEGIAIRQDRTGPILIYVLSDDNFSVLQRTLLMMFELTD